MCGGFTCSKNALIALNILYVLFGFLLIGVGVYSRAASIVTNLPIIGGILVCGVILILISVLGLIGANKHHQVMLFFYMIILFLLFLVQFSIACSCLAVSSDRQQQFAKQGWSLAPIELKKEVQDKFLCCGFNASTPLHGDDDGSHPSCQQVNQVCCPAIGPTDCQCPPCSVKLENNIDYAFRLTGSIGLFFSFTEIIAIFLTRHYRNLQDPDHLPARAIFPHSNYVY
ncbi:tetraspanin-31 isoform X1 [Anopheles bellator]|uniref:tetraspanin-31 isoform X1 n=1 Tax=Anopheles bellator TaxID=139047 RepID=UPI002648A4EC|nr:tetraspanin-31 isoform X1 [Anopheles bellator]